jgi:histidinol dehydrogenase
MIKIYLGREAVGRLTESSTSDDDSKIVRSVTEIIDAVRTRGDEALRELSERFGDDVSAGLVLTEEDVTAAEERVSAESKKVIGQAAENIRAFAEAAMKSVSPVVLEKNGWSVGLDYSPVESAGCYVPGGRYPLPSTALMTAVTAKAAGVSSIAVASPGMRDEVVYAAKLAGANRFYRVGGAQAIAALALGTETIKSVDMVVGPGNAYVTEAKRQLQGIVGIDMLAGPSEVAIIADTGANPEWVALDMLAQAEHDPDARAWLLTDNVKLAEDVAAEVERLLPELNLPDYITADESNLSVIVLDDWNECASVVDTLAPEHLLLMVSRPEIVKAKVSNYGAVFMGYNATVPFGDYMAGPNHTLPTGRTARYSGGLSPLTFLRPQSWFGAGSDIKDLASATEAFAEMEGLKAHAASARSRGSKSNQE